ncbi:MAG TPA: peptidoglycan DD-metalloendopeptidase family protein [Rhodanobacteraceae bacterium]|jgi:murein DD-endopeptidase MepM/ murein hydrolase activator NlpD|nr:peptidoglycan DD-metalloendopeptidase family protein [Rhodanobacteraceae bacterium]
MDRHLRRVTPHVVRRQAIRRKTRHCHSRFYARCAHWSFHAEAPASVFRWSRERWALAGGAFLLALLTLLGIPAWANVIRHEAVQPVTRKTLALPLSLPPAPPEAERRVVASWKTVEVEPGQTLSEIFEAQGLSGADLARVMGSGKDTGALKTLHPGDQLAFLIGAPGRLEGFRYSPDSASEITLTAQADGSMHAKVTALPVERRMHFAHGVVQGSLFAAGSRAGLSETMVLKLADVFKYDIDFIKDLQRGDRFTVVYDDVYRNGKFAHGGDIIAAEFVNKGHRYTAYRFKQDDGGLAYYSEDGHPLRKALLRTPVSFTRISSRFGMRKHPILGYSRMHKGVDYAAPTGTPIHAAGNGVIVRRGWVHGYGNFIEIKDTPKYSTAYGHMSRFAKGLHVGSRVTQGEVIGYVGQTGMATGPHLHYEVRVNGKPENPLTVTMPKPQPLSGKLMAQFRAQTAPMVARIQMIDNATQRLAQVDKDRSSVATIN